MHPTPAGMQSERSPLQKLGRLARLVLQVALGAALAIAAGWAGHWMWAHRGEVLHALSAHPLAVAGCVGCALAFVALRGVQLHLSARGSGVSPGGRAGARLFCEGVAVEAVSWPGKVWSDAYRWRALGEGSPARRLAALVRFRVSSILAIGCVLLASAALARWPALTALAAAAGAALLLAARRLNRRRACGVPGEAQARWLALSTVAGVGAVAMDAGSACLAAGAIAGADPLAFAPAFVLLAITASASTLPVGVGVLDAGMYVALTGSFGASEGQAVAAVLAYRLTGPGLTLLLGAGSLAARGLGRLPLLKPLRRPRRPAARPAAARPGVRAAFTIVEMGIVVMLIAIVAMIVLPEFADMRGQGYLTNAKALEHSLQVGTTLYLRDFGCMPKSFTSWVALTEGGNTTNYCRLGASFRGHLDNPNAALLDGNGKRLSLVFRNGFVAVYSIDSRGRINSGFAGPGAE